MADGGQVEGFVVVSACGKHRAIAQFRFLGLTGKDIHIYIHTYIQTGDDNASRLLASPFGSAISGISEYNYRADQREQVKVQLGGSPMSYNSNACFTW